MTETKPQIYWNSLKSQPKISCINNKGKHIYYSGTENEPTAKGSQDKFESIEVEVIVFGEN